MILPRVIGMELVKLIGKGNKQGSTIVDHSNVYPDRVLVPFNRDE